MVGSLVDGPVSVTVPATTANLGPGFDSLGLALDLRDRLTAEVVPEPVAVEVDGEGAGEVATDETHLVLRAMRAAFHEMGVAPSGVRLRCENVVPHARGLGSSSAAIVGGVALARGLVTGGSSLLEDEAAFRLAAGLEGHPDNVGPAWYGGFVVCGREAGDFYAVRSEVDPRVRAVGFVPPEPVSTEVARGLLPEQVTHADAAANAGRTALLSLALSSAPEHLFLGTRDYLHQHYRRPAMPQSLELVETLRADGVAAFVSGAGPTVLAFCAEQQLDDLLSRTPAGWRGLRLAPGTGVRLE